MSICNDNFLLSEYRSTKGASKQRRENINFEIEQMRNLLPLPDCSRKRLSQLQIMALSKTYIEMTNSFPISPDQPDCDDIFQNNEMLKALPGFLILLSIKGTILYISDNSTEYIGHSMVDVVSQCESIFEHMHEEDRPNFESLLLSVNQSVPYQPTSNQTKFMSSLNENKLSMTFRFALMKHIRRNTNFDRYKVLRMSGSFMTTQNGTCVFAGMCTPQFETTQVQYVLDTQVFVTTHSLDMNIINADNNGEHYLGSSKHELTGKSIYEFIHPQDVPLFASKHKELLHTQNVVNLYVRLLPSDGSVLNVQIVLKHVSDNNIGPLIISYHQIIDPLITEIDKVGEVDYSFPLKLKKEAEVESKLDRADILRRLKIKMDRRKCMKRKATPSDPPPYEAAIAPKVAKFYNHQHTSDQWLIQDNSSIMYGSPISEISDYHAVATVSETEDNYNEDFHHTNEIKLIPFSDQADIEYLQNEFNGYQFENDYLLNCDWSSLDIEKDFYQPILI